MKYLLFILFVSISVGCGGSHTAHNENTSNAAVDHSKMDHSQMDHSTMDHSKMESSPGAADAAFELQFLDTMIAHHQGAVDMARLAEKKGENAQFKKFADGIVMAQEREITQMKRWRSEGYHDEKPAINMDFPGMKEGMGDMDMTKLNSLSGAEFDKEFIRQMIPHHEGAVVMSKALLEKKGKDAAKPDLKKLAETIIKDQEAEIAQMKKWLEDWK